MVAFIEGSVLAGEHVVVLEFRDSTSLGPDRNPDPRGSVTFSLIEEARRLGGATCGAAAAYGP